MKILTALVLLIATGTFSSLSQANEPQGQNDLNVFVRLAKGAVPSVVNISTLSRMKTAYQDDPEALLRQFFGGGVHQNRPLPKTAALGTGFVIDPSGIILTNNHVVAGADEITVQFTENPEEKPTTAQVIGRDPELDIALIRVNTSRKLQALPLGDSDALEVGEYVMTVGNPFGNGHSVTHGIVSAKGRNAQGQSLANWLQIDAPINPGNSGGPLLNMKGEVVGINNAIDARAQGIGFAIPINYIKQVLPQLEKHGSVQRGYIGAVIGPLSPQIAEKLSLPKGIRAPFVTQINPGSPAEKAGLLPYDVITSVGPTTVHTPQELVMAITSSGPGQSIDLRVNRAGMEHTLVIRTEKRPTGESASADRKEELAPNPVGLSLQKTPDGKGVVIAYVQPGSTAESAGLHPGDEILEVDRKPVNSSEQFNKFVKDGKSYLLRVKRIDPTGQDSYSVVVLETEKPREDG